MLQTKAMIHEVPHAPPMRDPPPSFYKHLFYEPSSQMIPDFFWGLVEKKIKTKMLEHVSNSSTSLHKKQDWGPMKIASER